MLIDQINDLILAARAAGKIDVHQEQGHASTEEIEAADAHLFMCKRDLCLELNLVS